MTNEAEHEQKMKDLLNKKLAAHIAGYEDVERLNAVERCMVKFQCLDGNGRPTVTEWMHHLVTDFMDNTHWGRLLRIGVISTGKSPVDMMIDSRNLECMIKYADLIEAHSKECPHGATCGNYSIVDMLITYGRMPIWTWASYQISDDRDFEIIRSELSKWKNWRSVMGGDS